MTTAIRPQPGQPGCTPEGPRCMAQRAATWRPRWTNRLHRLPISSEYSREGPKAPPTSHRPPAISRQATWVARKDRQKVSSGGGGAVGGEGVIGRSDQAEGMVPQQVAQVTPG